MHTIARRPLLAALLATRGTWRRATVPKARPRASATRSSSVLGTMPRTS